MFLNYHLTQYHTDMSERLAKNIPGCQNKDLEKTKYKYVLCDQILMAQTTLRAKTTQARNRTDLQTNGKHEMLLWSWSEQLSSLKCVLKSPMFSGRLKVSFYQTLPVTTLIQNRLPREFVGISKGKTKCQIMCLTYVPFFGRENITSGVVRLPLGKGSITEFKMPFWCRRGKETHPYFCWTHN